MNEEKQINKSITQNRKIAVLRIGHRFVRDDRTTTHVGLVARAFGSDIIYMTDVDEDIKHTIEQVNNRWGGAEEFKIKIIDKWKEIVQEWKENKNHGVREVADEKGGVGDERANGEREGEREGGQKTPHGHEKPSNKIIVHLTMYGAPINEKINEIKSLNKDILIIIGAEKVPKEVYFLSDYNIAVGSQPHSEVAALAVFLDRLQEGKQFDKKFSIERMKIIPTEKGKNVIKVDEQTKRPL